MQSLHNKKIIFFANSYETFVWHRRSLAREVKKNNELIVILPNVESDYKNEVHNEFKVINIPLSRKSLNPLSELKTIIKLNEIIKNENPDILHNFTIKCVLYGSIVSYLRSIKKVVNTITGLGFVFISKSLKAKVIKFFLIRFYRFLFNKKNIHIIFQNSDDLCLFKSLSILKRNNFSLVAGSGVDIDLFSDSQSTPKESQKLKFLFMGRLLKDKGLLELEEAITILKEKNYQFEFIIAGNLDPANPNSLTEKDLNRLKRLTNYIGFQSNPSRIIKDVDVLVLPSYREGISKFLLEGMAAKKALIASNVPGCADLIDDGENGLLCEAKDASDLAQKIEYMIKNPNEVSRLGENSFNKVHKYGYKHINQEIMSTYL
jgi:glycosyltransferase involved in cell wall biosynthesis